jgi:hypothetical protein
VTNKAVQLSFCRFLAAFASFLHCKKQTIKTAPQDVPMITDALALQQASKVPTGLIPELRAKHWNGVITAAYGDPALHDLRRA